MRATARPQVRTAAACERNLMKTHNRQIHFATFTRIMTAMLFLLLTIVVPALAQTPPLPGSPEVHPDRSVTFRFRAANAKEVLLAREGAKPLPMLRDEQGVWIVTTEPLEPDFYGYTFVADGVPYFDPANPERKTNLLFVASMVNVPGPAALSWEMNDVPHGTVHHHFYKSATVGDQRDYYVYTPPGYDPRA